MRKKLWIFVGVLVGLMLVGYLLALISASTSDPSSATETTERRERSWLGDMVHAWNVTRPKGDGIRRVKSISPDSDTSECQWYNLSSDQMITTRFAGHVLQYPCTANHDGRSTVHYNQANEVIYQNHALYLSVLVGPDKETIWRRSHDDYGNEKKSFAVKLSSDGKPISSNIIKKWINNATVISRNPEKNLIIYLDTNRVIGFVDYGMNDFHGYPNITCSIPSHSPPIEIFSIDQKLGNRIECNGYWNLNQQIKVRVLHMNSNLASDFEFYYRKINQGLQDIIIQDPELNDE